MNSLGRAKNKVHLISVPDQPGEKQMYRCIREDKSLQSGHALEIWICECSLFYRIELWASKAAGFNSTKSLKLCECKKWCPKDLRVCAHAAPMLTHSLCPNIYTMNITFLPLSIFEQFSWIHSNLLVASSDNRDFFFCLFVHNCSRAMFSSTLQ